MEGSEEEEGEDEEEFWKALKGFFLEYKVQIGSLITAFAKNVERGPLLKFGAMIASFILIIIIIGILAYLGIIGVISGDAVAFLMGTIVGYLFSFLRYHIISIQ